MCKFHKDVARDIATDPNTGQFDAGKYSVALVAMAKFRIEQYMPPMHGCDGFVPALMTTDTAQGAFQKSGLAKSEADIQSYRDSHIDAMRAAIAQTASRHDLTLQGLGIPDNITKEGYKHCAKMPADITKSGPFLDEAVVQLYDGYDDAGKTYVSGELRLAQAPHKPAFAALHAATADFMAQPDVVPTLTQLFKNSLAHVFQTAQADLNAGRGLEKTDGCVMCHDHGGDVCALPAAEAKTVPKSLKDQLFSGCASCAAASGGTVLGAVASHIPCVAIPLIASATGVAVGGELMTASMLVTSPVVAAAATLGIDKLTGHETSKVKAGVAAGLAFSIALGVSAFNHRNHTMDMPGMGPDTREIDHTKSSKSMCGMPSMQHSFTSNTPRRATSRSDGDRTEEPRHLQSK